MCGRLTLKTPPIEWGQFLLPLIDSPIHVQDFQPRYNIAPTQPLTALTKRHEAAPVGLQVFRWGLIPAWSDQLSIGASMINARHESLREKRSFKSLLLDRRCIILADGYYEWQTLPDKTKQAFWIQPRKGSLLLLAGLWDSNQRATGQVVQSCTIITTAANDFMHSIHDRMPVALDTYSAMRWLDHRNSAQAAYDLLSAVDDDFFTTTAVSNYVNNARHEGLQCIQPLGPQ